MLEKDRACAVLRRPHLLIVGYAFGKAEARARRLPARGAEHSAPIRPTPSSSRIPVHGIAGAKQAGMRVIGFTGAAHSYPGHADVLTEAGAETVIRRWADFPRRDRRAVRVVGRLSRAIRRSGPVSSWRAGVEAGEDLQRVVRRGSGTTTLGSLTQELLRRGFADGAT